MIIDQEEFDKVIIQAEQQANREKMKQAIQSIQADLKPLNSREHLATQQLYLLNNPTARKNYVQKLKFEQYLDNIDSLIQADAEKFGYTSAFNWMLYLALEDQPTVQTTPPKKRRVANLPKCHSLISRITNYAYPTLIGQIEDGSLTVVNRKYEDCQYALLKQAPDEIELPDLRTLPYAVTLYSPEFYRQFDILKSFFVLFDDESEEAEQTTTRKPAGKSPKKEEAQILARVLAQQHWQAEAAKGKQIRISEMVKWLEKALIDRGYESELPDTTKSLGGWIEDIKPAYASVKGRPKKTP